ncbi:MFS transporter [Streptomyces sp. NPDC051940]|uniref:MFS transporter n=1 Tax=Streptomyces sp. NPDC051940 TaxID=3155675 RepID=UPI0034430508
MPLPCGEPREQAVDDRRQVKRGRIAIAAVFCVHGAVPGSFATRIPWIQDHAGLSAGQLGLALALPAIGGSLAGPMAAAISHRLGARRALRGLLVLWTLALALPSLAPNLGVLCAALFLFGAAAGSSGVQINAVGADTEKRLDRSIMSSLHGMWSAGALIGSAGGTLAAHLGVDTRLHHALAALVLTVAGLVIVRSVLDVRPDPDAEAPPRYARPPRSAVLIGMVAFCAVFAEGASLDWSGVYLKDALGASPGLAAATTTAFMLMMALARLLGDRVVNRFGAVRTVRTGGAMATAGGVLVVTAPGPAAAIAGFALIGLGVAVVVPLAYAAAAARGGPSSAQSIAGVATITYASGLIAPSLIGGIADLSSLAASFGVVTVLASGLLLGAGLLRKDAGGPVASARDAARVRVESAS